MAGKLHLQGCDVYLCVIILYTAWKIMFDMLFTVEKYAQRGKKSFKKIKAKLQGKKITVMLLDLNSTTV